MVQAPSMTGVFAGSGCSLAVGFDSAVSLGSQCGLHGGSESTSNDHLTVCSKKVVAYVRNSWSCLSDSTMLA